MKVTSSALALALAAGAAVASPLAKRDSCGQWDTTVSGQYTVYNNLWGESAASSGSQCFGVDSISGTNLAWHTSWTWAGGSSSVKSFSNAVVSFTATQLSKLSTIPTAWTWTYSGSSIVADVAYDMFLSSSASGDAEYEIMIWLAGLGGASPISSTGSPIATPTINGVTWKLYSGPNGQMTVYSFVAESTVNSFSGDIINFTKYLNSNQGLSTSQYLQSIGAGTEPFTGSNAVFTTTKYTVTV